MESKSFPLPETETKSNYTDDGFADSPSSQSPPPRSRIQTPIAVVGMACRLPGHSNSPTALWDFLLKGGIAKTEPPPSRFSLAGHYAGTGKPRTMKSPGGMFIEDVDPEVFDGQFFNISRAECIAMDPQQRQLLEVCYECLENAGKPLEEVSGTSTGVVAGINITDYGALQSRDPEDRAESITLGLSSALLSNRISHFLNIDGPSMTIDTACSASMVAVDVACRYLDTLQADAMLVGGANLWLSPELNEEAGTMNVTQSASGKCHSFDAKADGYVKAEGINAVYLKRLEDAVRDRDPIRAVIRGTAVGASRRTVGIANPSPDAQSSCIRQAYKNAGISDFHATGFLECHGTGTVAGDKVEIQGAASVFAAGREDKPGSELIIGAVKSSIGHSEAASGLSGLIKAVLVVESGIIPGNPTFLNPNPNINWRESRVRASRTTSKWPSSTPIRRAGVNSFGFGGANAHAVLEQSPYSQHISSYKKAAELFDDDDDDGGGGNDNVLSAPKLLVFSANDQASLRRYVNSLNSHLLNPFVSIDTANLAYTLSEKRTRHYYRAYSIQSSRKAKVIDEASLVLGKQASSPSRLGYIFTGQGAQWSQMGLSLVETFPQAKKVIQGLDKVLQGLPEPPVWSLLEELTEARTTKALRQPEFSQPLVTALQLALLKVLDDWGLKPKAVVGHSSGEIACAVAAGLVTAENAIKTAYYRGKAAQQVKASGEPMGMLAVGVGAETVERYLRPSEGKIQIACYNSPSSLTMSGPISALEKLCSRLQTDGLFARLLVVDLAYHSDYMAEIAGVYEELLLRDHVTGEKSVSGVRMFSSVTGKIVGSSEILDATYWKSNMSSPVQFAKAISELLLDPEEGADFLVEIGPSAALAGPIAQIKKSLAGHAANAPYTSTLQRGSDSLLALYNMAGQLFLSGGPVSLANINRVTSVSSKPIVDLPNYSWNKSTRYWHETRASKDWRFKKFVNHELIGSKIIGTSWQAPVFKKVLKLSEVPWLRDHRLGDQVVFPALGYVSMAVEALYQVVMVTQWQEQVPAQYRFRLQDVQFSRALVLDDNEETRVSIALTPVKGGSNRSWYEFRISSLEESHADPIHSSGLVCIETDYQDAKAPAGATDPLELATSSRAWYKALADAGYNFGPCFQKHLMLEMDMGCRNSRSLVNLEPPLSTSNGQSQYPMHPAVMDGCKQTAMPSLWKGDPSTISKVLVARVVDSLIVTAGRKLPTEGIALSSAKFRGVGDPENPRNYVTNVSLYHPEDGSLLFEMKGLSSSEIETREVNGPGHTITSLLWDADVDMLMAGDEASLTRWFASKNGTKKTIHDFIDLIAHKEPGLKVLEANISPGDASSLWIRDNIHPIRAACSEYHFAVPEAQILISARDDLHSRGLVSQFHLLDMSKPQAITAGVKFDLAIIKKIESMDVGLEGEEIAIKNLVISVREAGFVVAIGFSGTELRDLGKVTALPLPGENTYVCQLWKVENELNNGSGRSPKFAHVSLLGAESQKSYGMSEVLDAIEEEKCTVQRFSDPFKDIDSGQTVIILDEMYISVMDHLNEGQWQILKHLIHQRCRLLWITVGAQFDPTKATITGLFRTIRAEEQLSLMTLDLEKPMGEATHSAISACLERLSTLTPETRLQPTDYEFVEREGMIEISRLCPNAMLTGLQSDEISARRTESLDIHDCETLVRLQCERLGNLDALHFSEEAPRPTPLKDGYLEIEIYAAGLNYKDVLVTMGSVPGDETMLGHEAAGVVTKVTPGVATSGFNFEVGQRVVVVDKGCFANRLRTMPGRVHIIPDSMTLEEAATLSGVYLTAIHSLYDLANLTAKKRILIHSAAGGVGIAAIQLAQFTGAEIFATVGTPEKKEFLKSTFGLRDDRIFHSRNTDFAEGILAATGGEGVDIVLNFLVGDMLNESFRILADGGVMIEIGKKDILDRKNLPMAPFDRNVSFRAVDLSPEKASDASVSKWLSTLFDLIQGCHIKPISPIHRFSWTEVSSAIRFLRTGKHVGKVVLSDGANAKIQAPVRRAPKALYLRENGCYLIVGGLRGLCGSLAIYLAKTGVKNLAVMARSGYADDRSRTVIKQVNALGAHIDLLTADVTIAADVEKAFKRTAVPIAGIIQGAMVLRDRPFDSMTVAEYHEVVKCKIQGTWNLHHVAEKLELELDFFTMLSSISGVVGNRGQANYAAANVFLDSFAAFRHQRGQPACSVDLGIIEDAGFLAEKTEFTAQHFDARVFKGINDSLLRKILHLSILQQQQLKDPKVTLPSSVPLTQIVTGLITPQPADSLLKSDARFSALFTSGGDADVSGAGSKGGNNEVQPLILALQTPSADPTATLETIVDVVNKCIVRLLRLPEPMDPARPFSVYGIDSLSAVEIRNWVRTELGAYITTLDITNASSLTSFCGKIIAKLQDAPEKK